MSPLPRGSRGNDVLAGGEGRRGPKRPVIGDGYTAVASRARFYLRFGHRQNRRSRSKAS